MGNNITDIGPECFADLDAGIISYKGKNFYEACDAHVYARYEGGNAFCVKPKGHKNANHEAFDGTILTVDGFVAPPTCQYCLADPRFTPLAESKTRRCPVCGSSYTGPRRSKEYVALVEANLVVRSD